MPIDPVTINVNDLPKSSKSAIRLSLPASDHPTFMGVLIDKESNTRISPMAASAVVSAIAVLLAYFFGPIDSWIHLAIALAVALLGVPFLVAFGVLVATESSAGHQKAEAFLTSKEPEPEEVPLTFNYETNDEGDQVVTSIHMPTAGYTWAVESLYHDDISEVIQRHQVQLAATAKRAEAKALDYKSVQNAYDKNVATAVKMATTGDCTLAESISEYCTQLADAKTITESTDAYDTSQDCRHAESVAKLHAEALDSLKVYAHLPAEAVHTQLASGKTPTQELEATLAAISGEASRLAARAVQEHADKLSFMRRVSTEKYHHSALDS